MKRKLKYADLTPLQIHVMLAVRKRAGVTKDGIHLMLPERTRMGNIENALDALESKGYIEPHKSGWRFVKPISKSEEMYRSQEA